MHAVRLDFMVLSETHQTEAVSTEKIEIVYYDHYYLPSGSSRTGGFILYFKTSGR